MIFWPSAFSFLVRGRGCSHDPALKPYQIIALYLLPGSLLGNYFPDMTCLPEIADITGKGLVIQSNTADGDVSVAVQVKGFKPNLGSRQGAHYLIDIYDRKSLSLSDIPDNRDLILQSVNLFLQI